MRPHPSFDFSPILLFAARIWKLDLPFRPSFASSAVRWSWKNQSHCRMQTRAPSDFLRTLH